MSKLRNKIKVQRRLSSRFTPVMFHWTLCIKYYRKLSIRHVKPKITIYNNLTYLKRMKKYLNNEEKRIYCKHRDRKYSSKNNLFC